MKSIFSILMIALVGLYATSCKEDVSPTLTITAKDTLGKALAGVSIITHPCFFNQDNCDTARLNPAFHKEMLSNSAGQVTFEFPYSAVLDVVAIEAVLDSATGDTADIRYGQNVVSIETKELKKDEKNEYETTVVVDKFYRIP